MDILKSIQQEVEDFKSKKITIIDTLQFSQWETIKKVYFYYMSAFESGDMDSQGDKKYFLNIVRNPCNVSTKAIDFDTKDINIQTAAGGNPLKTWFFQRDLKYWMKDKEFGKILNRMFFELPIFGSVVLKVINGTPYFVDLRNFIVDQDADSLDESGSLIEKHNYTPYEFKRIGKEKGWDNIEETLEAVRRPTGSTLVQVYERYAEVEEDGKYVYKRVVMAGKVGKEDDQVDDTVPQSVFILDEREVKKHPYHEFHWEKIPGRWLGVGRIEILFDPQIRVNELTNLRVKSTYYTALRLWQTRDEGVQRNLLTDVINGEVINTEDPVTQVDMGDRNVAVYPAEINRWLSNRDELTVSYDVLSGERLPAGTPLGSAKLAAGMAGAYFGQIRENIALDVKTFLYEAILPQFEKDMTEEHILRIAGEDLDKLNNLLEIRELNNQIIEFVKKRGVIPPKGFIELKKVLIGESIKQLKEKFVNIKKDFYKDIKYAIDIVITGESVDNGTKAANLLQALQAITTDPTVLTDPAKKKIFYKYLEQGGISPIDIEPEVASRGLENLQQPPTRGAGGGISAPVQQQGGGQGGQGEQIF